MRMGPRPCPGRTLSTSPLRGGRACHRQRADRRPEPARGPRRRLPRIPGATSSIATRPRRATRPPFTHAPPGACGLHSRLQSLTSCAHGELPRVARGGAPGRPRRAALAARRRPAGAVPEVERAMPDTPPWSGARSSRKISRPPGPSTTALHRSAKCPPGTRGILPITCSSARRSSARRRASSWQWTAGTTPPP